MRNGKKFRAIAAVMALAVMLCSCGSTGGSTSGNTNSAAGGSTESAPEKLEKINVSHHPYIHGLPTQVAIDQGFYTENGLDPQVTMYAGGAAQNEAVATNAWDVGTTGMAGAVTGLIGYDLKVIGISASESATVDLWVRPDSPLANTTGALADYPNLKGTADDWKGITVICQSASNCQLVLFATLEKFGLSKDDINIVDMSVAQGFPAFKSGEADMVALWSPFGYQAEELGWVKVSSAEDLGLDFYNIILATDDAIENKPELVQKWLQTYQEGADYITAHKDEAPQWLYDFSMDEGITTTLENCEKDIEYRPFATVEQQKEYMDDGQVLDQLLVFAEFLKNQGNITQEDYDKLASGDCICTEFVDNLK